MYSLYINWCLSVSIREVLYDLLRTFSLCSGLFHRSEHLYVKFRENRFLIQAQNQARF